MLLVAACGRELMNSQRAWLFARIVQKLNNTLSWRLPHFKLPRCVSLDDLPDRKERGCSLACFSVAYRSAYCLRLNRRAGWALRRWNAGMRAAGPHAFQQHCDSRAQGVSVHRVIERCYNPRRR